MPEERVSIQLSNGLADKMNGTQTALQAFVDALKMLVNLAAVLFYITVASLVLAVGCALIWLFHDDDEKGGRP